MAPMAQMSGRPAPEGAREKPLEAGAELPSLAAQGWINGPPRTADELAGHLVVLDVWDELCSHCRQAAPDLVQVYRKYAPRGIVFVGLSVANQEEAQAFIDAFGIPWVSGYGALDTIKQLGAPPMLFVIDRSGRVAWNDDRGRSWHKEDEVLAELQGVLDSLLDEEPPTPPGAANSGSSGAEQTGSPSAP